MGTLIVGGIVLGLFILVAYFIYKRKKNGKSCCGGCKSCAASDYCHPKEKDKKED